MTRVLLWANYGSVVGGGERSLLELARGLAEAGDKPIVASPERGEVLDAAGEAGLATRLLPAPRLRHAILRPDKLFAARVAVAEAAAEVDLFHLSSPRQVPLVLGLGRPWIYHLRVAAADPFLDPLLRFADAVIANSAATAARARAVRRLRVIPNAITASGWETDRAAARAKWRIPAEARVVACIGRATPEKGYLDLAPALCEALRRDPHLHPIFAGDFETSQGRRLQEILRRQALARVRFLGSLEDPRPVYAAADLVLIPSRIEGFGRVALEAMAAGRPVLARRVGGLPEVLGEAGAYFGESPLCWTEEILALLDDAERREELARLGRVRADEFGMDRMIGSVREVYREVLATRRDAERLDVARLDAARAPAGLRRVRPEKPRLLIATSDYPPGTGGMSGYARGFAEGLARRGWDAEVLVRDLRPDETPPADRGASQVSPLPVRRFLLPPRSLARGGPFGEAAGIVRELRRGLRRRPADIVWAITWPGWGAALRLLGVPYVLSAHGADVLAAKLRLHDRLAAHLAFAGAVRILANSEYTAGICRPLAGQARASRVEVLPPGVDFARFSAPVAAERIDALRAKYGLRSRRVILTLGSLVSRKGHDIVLRSLAQLAREFDDLAAVFVGGWPYAHPAERRLKELASRLEILSRVRFVGEVSDSDVPAWVHMADLFAMPGRLDAGRGWVEGWGIAYLEAGAAGKAVIGTTAGGACEAIRDGETGVLVAPEDPTALAEALRVLLRDGKLRARLGAGGKKRAREFDWARQVERAEKILSEV